MIRPVLRAGKDAVASTNEVARKDATPVLFPNPGKGICTWELSGEATIAIFDPSGRQVDLLTNLQPGRHQWTTSTPGVYVFMGQTTSGERWTQRWIARP